MPDHVIKINVKCETFIEDDLINKTLLPFPNTLSLYTTIPEIIYECPDLRGSIEYTASSCGDLHRHVVRMILKATHKDTVCIPYVYSDNMNSFVYFEVFQV